MAEAERPVARNHQRHQVGMGTPQCTYHGTHCRTIPKQLWRYIKQVCQHLDADLTWRLGA